MNQKSFNIKFLYKHIKYKDIACLGFRISVGSENDFPNKKGIAHFTEHMLIEPYRENLEKKEISLFEGTTHLGFTIFEIYFKETKEYISCAIETFKCIINGGVLSLNYFEKVKKDILQEYAVINNNSKHLLGFDISLHPVGTFESINNITFQDILEFHKTYYKYASYTIYYLGSEKENIVKSLIKAKIKFFNMRVNVIEYKSYGKRIKVNPKIHFSNNLLSIKITQISNTILNRVTEDIFLIILENLFDTYFSTHPKSDHKIETNVEKHYFSYNNRYVYIYFNSKTDTKYTCEIWESAVKYFYNNLNNFYSQLIEEYTEYIKHLDLIAIFEWSEEIKNHINFGICLYSKNEYLDCLSKITLNDIKNMIATNFKKYL